MHLVVDRQIHFHVHLGLAQDVRHFARVLNIHDAQILPDAASLHGIRRHRQPIRLYLVDIALVDSVRRRHFRTAFVAEHRCAINRARSAFFRRVHVHPVGSDAFARFENEVRPFTFKCEYGGFADFVIFKRSERVGVARSRQTEISRVARFRQNDNALHEIKFTRKILKSLAINLGI